MKSGKIRATAKAMIAAGAWIAVLVLAQPGMAQTLKATPGYHDFGILNEGDPAEIKVEIANTGNGPVEITNVQTS